MVTPPKSFFPPCSTVIFFVDDISNFQPPYSASRSPDAKTGMHDSPARSNVMYLTDFIFTDLRMCKISKFIKFSQMIKKK